ncbi:MAG: recombinase family protein [Phenylobacterium sp.]|uniref:recombinase family protein n=1 Tax=Phenylobacterium sp. TaxID=1871053 RepID=UPI00391D5A93
MAIAYSYARFSSRAQAEGDTLRRQLSAAFAYADENGLTLDTTLQDHGVSAYTGANRAKGALKSFIDRVESGEIERGSYLLIDSMDRLSRQDVTQATHQLLGIALAGITVVTLNDGRKFDRYAEGKGDVLSSKITALTAERDDISGAHASVARRRSSGDRRHLCWLGWRSRRVGATSQPSVLRCRLDATLGDHRLGRRR